MFCILLIQFDIVIITRLLSKNIELFFFMILLKVFYHIVFYIKKIFKLNFFSLQEWKSTDLRYFTFCTYLDSRFSTLFSIFLTVLILFLFFFLSLCIFLYTLCILLLYGILTAFILSWYTVFVNRTMATACSSLNLFAFSCLFLFNNKILLTCLK